MMFCHVLPPESRLPDAHISFRSAPGAPVGPARPRSAPIRRPREGGGPSMAPNAAATGGEQGEPPAAAAKTKAGPRLGGRGDGRGHAIQSQRKQMCESGRESREDHADCHGMSCFVMVRSPLRPFAPARGSFTRHRASFRSMIDGVPPEAGERHCFTRIACAQACGCAPVSRRRAYRAPDCAFAPARARVREAAAGASGTS